MALMRPEAFYTVGYEGTSFAGFVRAHLEEPGALLDLAAACGLAQEEPVCLLCLERNPHHCHRLVVAERMTKETSQEVRYLFARQP
jgi:uncharacterized protein (DUF488 family)